MDLEAFSLKTVSDVTTPREGYVAYLNRWWAVTDGKVMFALRTGTPQCSGDRSVVEKVHPGKEIVLLPVAFVPNPYFGYSAPGRLYIDF